MYHNPCGVDQYYILYKYALQRNVPLYDAIFEQECIKKLLTTNGEYDLVIINGFGTEIFYGLAYALKVPVIQVGIMVHRFTQSSTIDQFNVFVS